MDRPGFRQSVTVPPPFYPMPQPQSTYGTVPGAGPLMRPPFYPAIPQNAPYPLVGMAMPMSQPTSAMTVPPSYSMSIEDEKAGHDHQRF